MQPNLSGSIDNDDDDGGLSAFDQSIESLSHGLRTVCSFDMLLGLDMMEDSSEDPVCTGLPAAANMNGSAKFLGSGWKTDSLKVQGGVSKKALGSCKNRVVPGCFDQDELGDVFQDLLDG